MSRRRLVMLIALLGTVAPALAADRPDGRKAQIPEAIDAEMLRDLDLLQNPDYARDREVARQLRVLERLRMLERLRALEEGPGPGDLMTRPAGSGSPAPREVK